MDEFERAKFALGWALSTNEEKAMLIRYIEESNREVEDVKPQLHAVGSIHNP